jgi:hypothetical protein
MKKVSMLFLFFALLLVCIASCSQPILAPPISTRSPTPEAKYSWWTQWLDQPACVSPCWQKITPGITSMKDALSILENMPEVKITYKNQQGITWRFNQSKTDSGYLYSLQIGTVSAVILGNSTEAKLFLEKVVDSYGSPSFVELYDCREGKCSTLLIYPNSGILLNVFLDNVGENSNQVKVSADSVIENVILIPTGLENFQKMPEYQGYNLFPWKGYSNYP